MEEKIKNALASIGFSRNETNAYLDLVRNGPSTVLEVAKRTEVHRTNIYDSLRRLIARGIVFEEVKMDKRLFKAGSPEKIVDYVSSLSGEIKNIIPYIKEVMSNKKDLGEDSIILSKGAFAVRSAINGLIELDKPISVYGASKEMLEILGVQFVKELHKERIKKKILMRHIYNEDMISRAKFLNSLKYTAARYLPQAYYSLVSTNICENRVILVVPTTLPSVITIKNDKIAFSYLNHFEALWSQAKTP